jgi:serine/threonine-protein kinase
VAQQQTVVPEPREIAGRYEVVARLGAGAFGTVYKAKDRMLGRMVAIKTIRLEGLAAAGSSLDELLTRFKREAMVSAQLKHPNIVTIYDIGESGGLSYLAMEFIDGIGLDRVIRDSGPLAIERAASIAAQVAEALDYAHKQNVVHRDIKPANIMLEPGDRVKVADFGIARVTNSTDALTATGSLLGTPSYMSPEQARGHELDGRSDLFSVGCVLYELISGRRAFTGESITGLIFKVITEEPPPLAPLRPQTPPELIGVVAKAMSKAADARYQSGREFARALQPFITDDSVPTLRQSEASTQELPASEAPTIAALPTLNTRETLAAAPTHQSPPPPAGRPGTARPVTNAAAPSPISAPPAAATTAPARAAAAPQRSGLSLALVAGAALLLGGGLALFYTSSRSPEQPAAAPTVAAASSAPPAATAAPPSGAEATGIPAAVPQDRRGAVAQQLAQQPTSPAAVATGVTATAPPPVEAREAARPAQDPAATPREPRVRAEAVAARPETPVAAQSRRPDASESLPRGDVRGAPQDVAAPNADFAFLEDEAAPIDGSEIGRRLAQAYRSGASGGPGPGRASRFRARERSPLDLSPPERPAVATLRHLINGQDAFYRQHERYGSLQELLAARLVVLDVPANADGFARRGYRFRIAAERDSFRVVAMPAGGGLRAFAGDETGFIRIGND